MINKQEKVQMIMKKRMMKVLLALTLVVSLCVGCGAPAGGNAVGTENEAGTEMNLGTESEIVDSTELDSNLTQQESEETEKSEYADFAIADVDGYVNVRKEPNTEADIVGKISDGAVAQILSVAGENDEWFQIVSGNVEGYIKAEFFIYGDDAVEVIDQYVTKYAKVNVQQLNVRADKSADSEKIGYLEADDKVKLLEDCGEWLRIQYREGKAGYVAAEYVSIVDEFVYGKTLEEEQKELEDQREREEREEREEEKREEEKDDDDEDDGGGVVNPPKDDYTTNEELRRAIVNYAMQYLGHRYVHGGQSLAGGTDCSGFTMYVLLEFGIRIGRTPQSQYTSAGRAISYSEIQPGDIICYSGNGGKSCTHVAFYIGDGKILHAANSRDGVKISSATYTDIYGVRNVID